MVADPATGMALKLGFKALGMAFGSKGKTKKATPSEIAADSLSSGGFQTSSIGISKPDTGRTPKFKASEEMYDYYQMVEKSRLVADSLDPEKGTQVGEFGEIKSGSIS